MGDAARFWFEKALEVPAAGRAAFLLLHCQEEAIRAEVLSLLEFDTGEPPLPPSAVGGALASLLGRGGALPPPRAGAFELGRLLGSGGMGLVYEAYRADGDIRQRAAVKFAQVSPLSSESSRQAAHRRFARERQMLASLRHPYIAGLIDAGATPDGTPYAVLEQVDGEPIDRYCDAHLPRHEDRIRLVIKLCDAVQFAHRNLIVHSDIKPDNVLVTPDGIPKLIDFGVASDLAEGAAISTVRAFTPGYASPEQGQGLPPTVATDVYGLGAVLYRLLTGSKPRQMRTQSPGAAVRSIWEEDVARPSTLNPDLKGDLENILLKALHREPSRRYGSVPEFAADLHRFLARRPVSASPDSILYRSSRFARRHWLSLSAAVLLCLLLLAVTVFSVREKREAQSRAAESRRLAERLIFEVHDEIGDVLGSTRARERLGAIAVQYLETLQRDHRRDPELAWELLNAYARLGQSRGGPVSSLGDTRSGLQLAAKTLALGAVVEDAQPAKDRLDRLFTVYEGLVPVLLDGGRSDQQRELVDRLLRLAPQLGPLREAQAYKQLARLHDEAGSQQQASQAWTRAIAILRTVPGSAEAAAHLVSTLVGYGRAQALDGNFTAAASSISEAIRLAERGMAAEPHIAGHARHLYWSHIALGDVLGSPFRFSLGRTSEAVEQYRKAATLARRLATGDPGNDMAKLDLVRALNREAMALASTKPARAVALLDTAHSIAGQTSSRNHLGVQSRFTYLTSSIPALVASGANERAATHTAEARRLVSTMESRGIAIDRANLHRAEAIRLHAAGRRKEAIVEAHKELALLPASTRPVLSENYRTVEVLERLLAWSSGVDAAACAGASSRLENIWRDLRAAHPRSEFVRTQSERVQALVKRGCKAHTGTLSR